MAKAGDDAGFDALRDLYQEVILEHGRRPRHQRRLDPADAAAKGDNPMCGDRVEVRLRYGAGAKGEVASSLANAVPCVVTSVAAEGMSLLDQDGVLVRDAPADFAAAIASAYTDAGRWRQLSQAGLAYAERTLSPTAWQSRLEAVVWRLGL